MRRLLGLALPGVIATAMVLALNCGQALASNVHCGDVITQDTTLDSDLSCSSQPALTIQADDNVTLDLAGHTIRSEGEGAGPAITTDPYSHPCCRQGNVTIENGVLDRGGVSMEHPNRPTLRGLTLVRGASIYLVVAGEALIEDNQVLGVGGIYLGVAYDNSQVRRNVLTGGFGIFADQGSESVSITDNVVRGGSGGVDLYRSEAEIVHNRILDNAGPGISLGRSNGTVDDNVISGNGAGVDTYEAYASLRANVITHNSGNGIVAGTPPVGETCLKAENNVISRNGENGVLVRDLPCGGDVELPVELIGNTISANRLDGVHVDQLDPWCSPVCNPKLVFDGNRTDRNGDDGIDTENPDATLMRNHAWFNGDLGIEAVLGVTGSGNWAKHNGNRAQCVPGDLCSTTGKPRK